jgi:hypothetical protein
MLGYVRREHTLDLTLNGRTLKRVLIDSHYELRHRESITDALILDLLRLLNGEERHAEAVTKDGFEVFKVDPIHLNGKVYRLILTLPPARAKDADYVGVVNAFRVQADLRKRKG